MVNKIKKVGFITSALILGVGANITLSARSFLTSDSTSNSSTSSSSSTKTQLATVTSIEYDYTNNLLTWSKVENANEYNVSINGDIKQVEDASISAIQERSFRELIGNFFEYAQELDEMQSSL